MKYRILTALTAAVLLAGCAGSAPPPKETVAESTSAAETEPTEAGTEAVSSEAETAPEDDAAGPGSGLEQEIEPQDLPPEEGYVRSFITNEWVPGELDRKRPIAVMYPTDQKAQPQYGLDRVLVFYEIMEEGSMSRQMGILQDFEDLERIGNLRSIRDYFIYEALEWDSILVHYGGPEVFVKGLLRREDVDNINGVDGPMGPSYGAFYRVPKGTNSVHSAYTDGAHLAAAIEKGGFERNLREKYYQPERWHFASESAPVDLSDREDAVSARKIDLRGCYPVTKTAMEYHEEDGLYYRSIYGKPQCDAVTGDQLAFSNILIKSETSGGRGGGYLYFHSLDGGHEGYYLTRGRMIHCTWVKTNEYEPTRFYDDSGEEITLNTGKTMVFVTRTGQDHFTADEIRYDF